MRRKSAGRHSRGVSWEGQGNIVTVSVDINHDMLEVVHDSSQYTSEGFILSLHRQIHFDS